MEYHLIPPEQLPKLSVYLTHADSFLQKRYRIDASELTKQIRFLCLSQRSIIIPTSFILKSDITYETIKNNLPLLEEGMIVPAISLGCGSFSSYCELRKSDRFFLKIGCINQTDLHAKVRLLENHSKQVLFYDEDSMKESFIESLANDVLPLIDNKGKAVKTLKNLPKSKARREHVLKAFEWLPTNEMERLSEYLDMLYYFQGGIFNNLNLNIHPSYLLSIKTKLMRSLPRTDLPAKYDCFKQAINVLNLSPEILLSLDPEELLDLRRDPTVKRFLDALEKIYNETRYSTTSKALEFSDLQELHLEMDNAIASKLSSEIKTYRRYRKGKNTLKGFAYITGLLPFLSPQPALGFVTALTMSGTSYKLIDPFLDRIWKRIGNCEMIFFTQVLLDATYQPKNSTIPETPKSFFKKCVKCNEDIPIASEECPYCTAKQPEYAGI